MSEEKLPAKAGRPARTLLEEIAAAEARLEQLKKKQKEQERARREANQRAILSLIRSEGLDEIAIESWREQLPRLKTLLDGSFQAKPTGEAKRQTGHMGVETAQTTV